MTDEALTKSLQTTEELRYDLQCALNKADRLSAPVILQLIGQAADLRIQIKQLIEARKP